MLHEIDNILEMTLRLKRLPPISQTIREIQGIARRLRTKHDLRLGRTLPIHFTMVRRKLEQIYVFRTLSAVNLDFHLLI